MIQSTYEVIASPMHDPEAVGALVEPVLAAIERAGGSRSGPRPDLAHLIVVATGGTEMALLDRIDEQTETPAVLIAHPRHNSLPAALEALARCRQLGRRARIVFVDDEQVDRNIEEAIADLTAWHRFHRTRLGVVGAPSDWLVASMPPAESVRRRWGPELVDIAIPEVIDAFRSTPVDVGRAIADRMTPAASASLPAPGDVATAARLDPGLRGIIERHRLDAITVRCFDLLESIETSGCLALARLNDDGVVAGCEGDIPTALAMLWARHLLDRASWVANPASIDPTAHRILLAHCTIAPSLVESVDLSTHFESGIGVGLHGRLRHGAVTLIRIGGADLERCWIAEGEVTDTGADGELCRTQATVTISDRRLDELLTDPLGNHLVLVEGHHRRRLERWWNWALGPPFGE